MFTCVALESHLWQAQDGQQWDLSPEALRPEAPRVRAPGPCLCASLQHTEKVRHPRNPVALPLLLCLNIDILAFSVHHKVSVIKLPWSSEDSFSLICQSPYAS